jgi:hypothetical protein
MSAPVESLPSNEFPAAKIDGRSRPLADENVQREMRSPPIADSSVPTDGAEPANKDISVRHTAPTGTPKIVRRKFGEVAKILWDKPDVAIATIAKCDPRTGRRILRGELDVPACVLLAADEEMLRPLD